MYTEAIMWEAVEQCNSDYDGYFFYAVKTTKIFCRPSCKSRTPVRKNVSFFLHAHAALEEGYRPCKRCRPDCLEASDDKDMIVKIKGIMEQSFTSPVTLELLTRRVGMSKFHLIRTFKRETGATPIEFLTQLRINHAKDLLKRTNLSVTQIAYESGYRSSSHFTVVFRNRLGCSPTAYRDANE